MPEMWFLYVNISHVLESSHRRNDARLPVIRRYIIMSIIQRCILSLLVNVDSMLWECTNRCNLDIILVVRHG